jgi:hypothetical protein
MRDTEYVERLQRHLSKYRAETLRRPQGEWGTPAAPYAHVLRRDDRQMNIVEPIRDRFWKEQEAKGWTLHRFFHHLSSSQALAFNLFFPLYPDIRPTFVKTRAALGIHGTEPARVDFEVELTNADGTKLDGTNIDVLISEVPQRRAVIEVKLTEATFGRAAHDRRHLDRLRTIYTPLLEGRLDDSLLQPTPFFRDYQLLRNLAQLRRGSDDRVLLLLPKARQQLWQFATDWCSRPELGTLSGKIAVVALEDVLAAMQI